MLLVGLCVVRHLAALHLCVIGRLYSVIVTVPRHFCTSFRGLYVNIKRRHIQLNLHSSNTDGSFTMANSNSVLSPYEILPMDQENKYLRKLSYFIMKLYVVCTH